MAFPEGYKSPGRPKGSPNKLTRTVRQAFEEAFELLQADPTKPHALGPWGMKNPDKFYLLAAFTARLASRRDGEDEEEAGSDLA